MADSITFADATKTIIIRIDRFMVAVSALVVDLCALIFWPVRRLWRFGLQAMARGAPVLSLPVPALAFIREAWLNYKSRAHALMRHQCRLYL